MQLPEWTRSVHHDGSAGYVRTPAGCDPDFGDEVEVRLRAAPDAPIDRVLLRTCPEASDTGGTVEVSGELPFKGTK